MSVMAAGRFLKPLLFLLAIALIIHGLFGPQFAPKNLTTLFVWIHYRGLLVISILVFANLLCAGCPFVFARDLGRRFFTPRRLWPMKLRNKWIAIALFVLALFAYERFQLWGSPFYTALLILGFFIVILAIDLTFKGATFCKYICPVGQFNFLSSMLSPFEVKAKSAATCGSCKTYDCLKGNLQQRGCELKLFIPKKTGNFDCTFCMDCKRACPHDNVELAFTLPGRQLADDLSRSGLGRLWQRRDFTCLIIAFTFGGLLNAFAMVTPAHQFQKMIITNFIDTGSSLPLVILFLVFLLVAPLLLFAPTSWIARHTGRTQSMFHVMQIQRFLPALIPIGFGIWAAHYSFHFLTGALTFLPILWSSVLKFPAAPNVWAAIPMGVPITIVTPIQISLLLLACMVSVVIAHEIALQINPRRSRWLALPWQTVVILITAFAAWVFTLPMDMRGTFIGG